MAFNVSVSHLLGAGRQTKSQVAPAAGLLCDGQTESCYSKAMTWARKLAKPIALKDGRTIVTLSDARAVMQSLSERHRHSELWLYVGALMLEAAVQGRETTEAVAQLNRALKAEGLIAIR